jgi:hypothetical protein
MVTPGQYKAAIQSHAITETKEGKPQAHITFEFEADGREQTIGWFGSFSEKAAPHTIKALLTCGLTGNNPAGALEIGKEVSITIEDEVGQDGKTRSRVRWINPLSKPKAIISPDLAKTRLAQLEGAVMKARIDLNIKDEADVIPF